MNPLPQRPIAHVVGDEAVRLFVEACPKDWVVAPVAPDYGLDVRVELVRAGAVTGEEFGVQIKGRQRIEPSREGVVTVVAKPSTVNYWLGKLNPTMIVAADTSRRKLWFGWLEQAYADYPRRLDSEGEVELALCSEVAADFSAVVSQHVAEWFSRLRDEVNLLPDRAQLSRFSLHVAGLVRSLTQIHLALTSGASAEELQDPLQFMFLEFGVHDSFLLGLWETDSPWHQPLSSRSAGVVAAKLQSYMQRRSQFWMREKRVTRGDIDLVPFSYRGLKQYLVPALESAWDLQDALNQLIVLGSIVGADKNRSGAPNKDLQPSAAGRIVSRRG